MGGRGSASGGGYRGTGININAKVGEFTDGSALRLSFNSSWKSSIDTALEWSKSPNKALSQMGKRQIEVIKRKAKQAVKSKDTALNISTSEAKYIQSGR